MAVQDIALDDTDDLQIKNGDFVIGLSEETHLEHLLKSSSGDWKHDPLVGASLPTYLKSGKAQKKDTVSQAIRLQLDYDGWDVNQVNTDDLSNIQVDATKRQ